MEATFKRIHENAKIPTYGSEEAACCDLYLCEDVDINAGELKFIPIGLIAAAPKGYHWQIYLRSSAPRNHPGLTLANHVGIVDSDYSGPEDEIKLLVANIGIDIICLKAGERIAQMELVQNVRAKLVDLTEEMEEKEDEGVRFRRGVPKFRGRSRGGFGSTGK